MFRRCRCSVLFLFTLFPFYVRRLCWNVNGRIHKIWMYLLRSTASPVYPIKNTRMLSSRTRTHTKLWKRLWNPESTRPITSVCSLARTEHSRIFDWVVLVYELDYIQYQSNRDSYWIVTWRRNWIRLSSICVLIESHPKWFIGWKHNKKWNYNEAHNKIDDEEMLCAINIDCNLPVGMIKTYVQLSVFARRATSC